MLTRMDFRDRRHAGELLKPLVAGAIDELELDIGIGLSNPLMVVKSPSGVAVAAALEEGLRLASVEVPDAAAVAVVLGAMALEDRTMILVDDGVETGRTAASIAAELRAEGARRVWLAVPVCSRQSEAALSGRIDLILAVARPLGRRSLHWHYETLDD